MNKYVVEQSEEGWGHRDYLEEKFERIRIKIMNNNIEA
jgi:hypothetical protein